MLVIKNTVILIAIILLNCCSAYSQNIENIGKEKTFAINGSIGASADFYSSNEQYATRDPFSWNIHGNFNTRIYGIDLPFSFILNQYSRSYTTPFAQFGLSPSYKWIKLHLGYRSIQFSPFTFDGQSFRGIGMELTSKLLRFGAFYGKLNRAVSEDTANGKEILPQYSRKAYGIKLGVGNANNFLDFIYFKAKDDSTSIKTINKYNNVRPQENTVLGSSFKITLLKKISFSGDVAVSGITQDQAFQKAKTDSATPSLVKFFSKLMPLSQSNVVSLAGQSQLAFTLTNFNALIGYRRVDPSFKSLGTPYTLNDAEAFTFLTGFTAAKGKLHLNATLVKQHNNLDKVQLSTMHNFLSNISLNTVFNQYWNLSGNFSFLDLLQKDGIARISDTMRLHQQTFTASIAPVYNFTNSSAGNSISISISTAIINDKNKFTRILNNSNNYNVSLNYTHSLLQKAMSYNGNLLFNQYKKTGYTYTSAGINLGVSAQLLKNKNLNLQMNAGYLVNNSSNGDAASNITGALNAGYVFKKKHTINIYANYVATPPNGLGNKVPYAVTTNNLAGGLAYNFRF